MQNHRVIEEIPTTQGRWMQNLCVPASDYLLRRHITYRWNNQWRWNYELMWHRRKKRSQSVVGAAVPVYSFSEANGRARKELNWEDLQARWPGWGFLATTNESRSGRFGIDRSPSTAEGEDYLQWVREVSLNCKKSLEWDVRRIEWKGIGEVLGIELKGWIYARRSRADVRASIQSSERLNYSEENRKGHRV